MKILNIKYEIILLLFNLIFYSGGISAQDNDKQGALIEEMPDQKKEQRTEVYRDQLEKYLQQWIIEGYEERATDAWHRDYSSIDAFKRSVEPNRERWKAILNPPELRKTGPMKKEPHPYLKDIHAEWVELPLGPITAQGLLVFPAEASENNPVPIIVVQHGIGSYPETPFSLSSDAYHAYARELLKAGFAVLAPMNLRS
ncbi:MAG: hypothetical protein KAR17_12575, partial [Cyclobacteriaceae bacterium]|nr:hypothetical protein [Cyclobacteriaceae bacterium]